MAKSTFILATAAPFIPVFRLFFFVFSHSVDVGISKESERRLDCGEPRMHHTPNNMPVLSKSISVMELRLA